LFTEWETCSDIELIVAEIVARPRFYNIPTAGRPVTQSEILYVELSKAANFTYGKFIPTIARHSSDDVIAQALIRDIDRHH
jgi:hypothetical protein